MFVVQLRFSRNKGQARQFMQGHKDWLQQGFDDGVFLLAGNLQPNLGGAVLADNTTRESLDERIRKDPFVAEDVVTAEVLEITPARADERLAFLIPVEQDHE